MCGIIYTEGKKALSRAINQYHYQKDRGTDGFGAVLIYKDGSYQIVRDEAEKSFLGSLKRENSKNLHAVMMHHRLPTSTDNEIEQTHPIETTIEGVTYLTVHNGVISNTNELKNSHYEQGLFYSTKIKTIRKTRKRRTVTYNWNDSESLGIELALYFSGRVNQIKAKGSIAFITAVIKKGKVTKIYFGRNKRNPLEISRKKDRILIASDIQETCFDIDERTIKEKDLKTLKLKDTRYSLPVSVPEYSFGYNYHFWDDYNDYYQTKELNKFYQSDYEPDYIEMLKSDIKEAKNNIEKIKHSSPLDEDELDFAEDYLKELEEQLAEAKKELN